MKFLSLLALSCLFTVTACSHKKHCSSNQESCAKKEEKTSCKKDEKKDCPEGECKKKAQ